MEEEAEEERIRSEKEKARLKKEEKEREAERKKQEAARKKKETANQTQVVLSHFSTRLCLLKLYCKVKQVDSRSSTNDKGYKGTMDFWRFKEFNIWNTS